MRQKFNVELINKMAHSVCLLVESVCGDIIKNTDITDNSLSLSLLHTLRHSSYWQVYVLNPSIKRTIKMPAKGTLYENFLRSGTFIVTSSHRLDDFVHISINAPKFKCRLAWVCVCVRQSTIMCVSDGMRRVTPCPMANTPIWTRATVAAAVLLKILKMGRFLNNKERVGVSSASE